MGGTVLSIILSASLHNIKFLLIFIDLFLESIQIEFIFDEFFINFTKEDMIFKATKPLNPSNIDIFAELWLLTHFFKLFIIWI